MVGEEVGVGVGFGGEGFVEGVLWSVGRCGGFLY